MVRTHLRAAALAAALVLPGASYLLPRAAAQRPRKARVDARRVFTQYCARCHGADGSAQTEQGELYNATDFTDAGWWREAGPTDARLRRFIVHGGSGMPAFGKRLSAAQINALVPYVRAFKGK